MDRMPKEYKIPVYIISMTLAYFAIYLFVLFRKYSLLGSVIGKTIIIYASVVAALSLASLAFFLLKKEIGRIGLIVVYGAQIVISFALLASIVFLKQSSVLIAKAFKIGVFDVYMLVPILGSSPGKGIISLSILSIWFAIVIYLLNHREVKEFMKTKTYPLVNTQKQTVAFIIAYFISLGIISILIGL